MKASQFLDRLATVEIDKLEQIKGLGPILISNLKDFLSSSRYQNLLQQFQDLELQNQGLEITLEPVISINLPLRGQKICITGSFEISRNEIKEKLESLGAEVVNTISKNTTILVAGEDAGSKLTKAVELGIRVESDLSNLDL